MPDRKAGRVYGGNAGLAISMCAARKKRQEPAGLCAGLIFHLPYIFLILTYFYNTHGKNLRNVNSKNP
jgi:hypothetical protein